MEHFADTTSLRQIVQMSEERKKLCPTVPPSFTPKRKNGKYMTGEWHPIHKGCVGVKACGYCFRCNHETYIQKYSEDISIKCMFCEPRQLPSVRKALSEEAIGAAYFGKHENDADLQRALAQRHKYSSDYSSSYLSVWWVFY